MRAYIKKEKAYQSIIETAFNEKNTFSFSLIKKGEVLRYIHIRFKKALCILPNHEIRILYFAEYVKEKFEVIENPYKCTIDKLIEDLSYWVSDMELTVYGINYKLELKESKQIVKRILFSKFPDIYDSYCEKEYDFIKYLSIT